MELTQLFQVLTLLPKEKDQTSFMKTMELLTLRRVHTFSEEELSSIIKAYSLLVQQDLIVASTTFIGVLDSVVLSKHQQYFKYKGALCQAIAAFMRLEELGVYTIKSEQLVEVLEFLL